jgi:hypothetical protein
MKYIINYQLFNESKIDEIENIIDLLFNNNTDLFKTIVTGLVSKYTTKEKVEVVSKLTNEFINRFKLKKLKSLNEILKPDNTLSWYPFENIGLGLDKYPQIRMHINDWSVGVSIYIPCLTDMGNLKNALPNNLHFRKLNDILKGNREIDNDDLKEKVLNFINDEIIKDWNEALNNPGFIKYIETFFNNLLPKSYKKEPIITGNDLKDLGVPEKEIGTVIKNFYKKYGKDLNREEALELLKTFV